MIPKQVLDLAFKGGWGKEKRQFYYWQMTVCDPTFWQALGKELGWEIRGYGWHAGGGQDEWHDYATRFYTLILTTPKGLSWSHNEKINKFWEEILK